MDLDGFLEITIKLEIDALPFVNAYHRIEGQPSRRKLLTMREVTDAAAIIDEDVESVFIRILHDHISVMGNYFPHISIKFDRRLSTLANWFAATYYGLSDGCRVVLDESNGPAIKLDGDWMYSQDDEQIVLHR